MITIQANRKPVSSKARYDVLKRDGYACQCVALRRRFRSITPKKRWRTYGLRQGRRCSNREKVKSPVHPLADGLSVIHQRRSDAGRGISEQDRRLHHS
jgi:hypothetical protein